MKKKNVLFLVVCVLVVGAYLGYRYLYKDHRDIQGETASMEVTSSELLQLFQNEATPDALNKAVIVSGSISEFDTLSITLDNSVHCALLEPFQGVSVGAEVRIKGRCIGYDDLFELVKIDQSQLINQP